MGGSSNPRSNYPQSKNVSCEDLTIKTQLYLPVEEVIKLMNVNEILDIELTKPDGPCMALYRKQIAGMILIADLKKLIDCMKGGNKYKAIIRSIKGVKCAITIKHENSL